MLRTTLTTLFLIALSAVTPALGATSQELAEARFYANTAAERDAATTTLQQTSDPSAQFLTGASQLQTAVEGILADMQRYGFNTSEMNAINRLVGLPAAPATATPAEPIDYKKLRAALTQFDDRLASAIASFASIPNDAEIGVALDLEKIPVFLLNTETIPDLNLANLLGQPTDATFRFDRADAYWFQGYANVLRAHSQFILAHDFERSFDLSFNIFFPNSMPRTPLNMPVPGERDPFGFTGNLSDSRSIADIISFIHLFNLPVIEPARRAAAADHLKEMIRLSRLNWQSINAETDNDHEWLPGSHQPGNHPIARVEVSESQVIAWHKALDLFDEVLDGERLVPHWRFPGMGINIASLFKSSENFDPILILTGPGVLPFLEKDKPMIDARVFEEFDDEMGPLGLIGTAFWFN